MKLRWLAAGATAAGAAVALAVCAARRSPVPAAMVVRPVFDMGSSRHGPYAAAASALPREERLHLAALGLPVVGLRLYRPAAAGPWPIVVYIHGGGFIGGSASQVRAYCEALASQGFLVASVEYTLAPTLKFPGALRQVIEVLRQLPVIADEADADASRVVLAGDSAGAHIAASVAAALTNREYAARLGEDLPGDGTVPGAARGGSRVRATLLFCGPYDVRVQQDAIFPGVNIFMFAYTGRRDWKRWERVEELAPNKWVTRDFPPTFFTVGDADPLAAQTPFMENVLREAGVETEHLYWTGHRLPHEYQRELHRPEAQEAFRRTVEFLRVHLAAG